MHITINEVTIMIKLISLLTVLLLTINAKLSYESSIPRKFQNSLCHSLLNLSSFAVSADSHVGVQSTCAELTCNNGKCNESPQGATCVCDEGFLGTKCDQQGADFYHRTEIVPGLADPDILAVHDDLFFLSGTSNAMVLPIYESIDLKQFRLKVTYNPSIIDPMHNYCEVWAPDLSKRGSGYDLYFSAQRVLKSFNCPLSGQDVTTFVAHASDENLRFGAPTLVDFGNGAPKGRIASGCNSDGCIKTIRIDSAIVGPENDRWFFYVWFQGGNNIVSFPLSSPNTLIANAGPASFSIGSIEENINEGPDVFYRGGQYYFFFSYAFFNSQYAMAYIMAPSISDLTRKRAVRVHSVAQRNAGGKLVQTHGHNSIVERRGQFFNIFHQGIFDSAGRMIGRSTFKQRIAFRPDGSIHTLNTVDLRWTQLSGYQYSLDIVKKDGSTIGPCIAVGRIGASLGTTYTGICPDGRDQLVDKGDIAAFRLFYSSNNIWGTFVEKAYDGVSDELSFFLPGGVTKQIVLSWNERMTNAEYSLDVRRKDGTWIAPCVADVIIGRQIRYVFDGNCPSSKTSILPSDVSGLRICSALNDDWARATCGDINYDGKAIHVAITIPQ